MKKRTRERSGQNHGLPNKKIWVSKAAFSKGRSTTTPCHKESKQRGPSTISEKLVKPKQLFTKSGLHPLYPVARDHFDCSTHKVNSARNTDKASHVG